MPKENETRRSACKPHCSEAADERERDTSGGMLAQILPRYYETDELARHFRRDPHTIRDWIRFGCPTPHGRVKLPAVKLGKKWVVREDALALFEHRVRPVFGRPELDLE